MDTLTLKGRGGVEVTLFAPREVPGGLEACAVMVLVSASRPRIVKHQNRKYRLPALPPRGFYMATLLIPEAPRGS
ncbi:hypothetical protein [Deinococcus navajonensis]|uniref:Uncharacterized protein n=1 Tax=Deinococcus navajonensis TaxID=309884 RepID=A0ABV8XTL2_9DEIO